MIQRPSDDFRVGMRRLAGGVCVISGSTKSGEPCGLTATAVCSLTADPPSLVACINKDTRLGAAVRTAPAFAVNVLSARQRPVAEAFAGLISGVWGEARFSYGEWREERPGVPLLADSPASFVCELDQVVDRSTHLLLIGLVVDVRLAPQESNPLLYVDRQFVQSTHKVDSP
ncbi:flavin reductase family protein [Streptomyces sp. NBC_00557]|uniref:flavin reductase family protein n=1 Tax=Streptomyces sp. NBC_00557 TaxID=2975776 RepID=UPI002E7FD7D6|nr:flavin reductase family protein [Streptomyces sp. NBC_00557]WUC40317.1 flavin reductase family protein [Streptomyces sp. NBC_00557]